MECRDQGVSIAPERGVPVQAMGFVSLGRKAEAGELSSMLHPFAGTGWKTVLHMHLCVFST